jgi:hypothetical protein
MEIRIRGKPRVSNPLEKHLNKTVRGELACPEHVEGNHNGAREFALSSFDKSRFIRFIGIDFRTNEDGWRIQVPPLQNTDRDRERRTGEIKVSLRLRSVNEGAGLRPATTDFG